MTGFRLPDRWPRPADERAAASLAQDLVTAPDPAGLAVQLARPDVAALVACLGGNSPYLADLARRERACFADLLRRGPTPVAADALRRLRALKPGSPRPEIASGLRQAKRQVALASAIGDIGGLWSLEQVTGTLSLLAEASLQAATAHLLLSAEQAGLLRLPDRRRPQHGSGFVVLAMGKLGARELNYSSDIDLVLLYDPDVQTRHGERDDLRRTFVRMATDLVSLMEARDADGYVFRMDLRLRPDPAATPPAIALPSAIAYYESYGETWERAAMTKARAVAGDIACGERFLSTIQPFIWRRHLDFAAIDDIHTMKRRIDRHKSAPARGFDGGKARNGTAPQDDAVGPLLGHDVKLGHGGIREIEFIAQTLQLVWGGREPALREPTTLGALERLAASGTLQPTVAASLARAYRLLRGIEHRLQMQADRQTHSLPATRAGFDAFVTFMGGADTEAFAIRLLRVLRLTRARFERMFDTRPAHDGGMSADRTPFDLDDPDLAGHLRRLGFPPGPQALEILRGWRGDRLRALRSDRARSLLHGLVPELLQALSGQRDPLAALVRFDVLLSRQVAGVQLLSLFARNPALLGRIVTILGASPSLADHLAAVPSALEGLLIPEEGQPAARTLLRLLDGQMRRAAGVEEAIGVARALVRGEEFRLSVAQMEGRLSANAAGVARTALAETVIARMLDHVLSEHRRRHGVVPGGGLVVVALGKAGSREMMSGSDLDLMLVYDHPDSVLESVAEAGGPRGRTEPEPAAIRAIPSSQYYTRLAQSLIGALSAPGIEGPLYAIDMRLRPSGAKGPLAVSLGAFRRYHAERAWTWERMALSRARVVAGPRTLRRHVGAALADALSNETLPSGTAGAERSVTLRRDACAMRARLARDLAPHGPWDVKLRAGGLMEVEFIAQVLQLVTPHERLRHPTTRIALRRLAAAGVLPRHIAERLIDADHFWRALQGMLRILLGVTVPRHLDHMPAPVIEALLRGLALGQDSLATLEMRRDETAATVREAFLCLVGPLPPV